MGYTFLRVFGVALLAATAWAQSAPATPAVPPPPPQDQQQSDTDKAQADAEKARAEAQKQAEQARAEAQKEAQRARVEAQKSARQARREVEKAHKDIEKNQKMRVMMLREGGTGSYLGVVDPRDVTADRVGPLKLKDEQGVEVSSIDRDSPAGKAGLKDHDVILSFNGQKLEGVEQLRRMIRETPPGRTVSLGISRDGQPMNVNVTLAKRADTFAMGNFNNFVMPKVNIPPMPPMDLDMPAITVLQFTSRSGMMVEDLTPQLGDFFGVKDGQGVLVRSVQKGSSADAAGLKAGDVIVKAGNERITCSSDWRRILRETKPGALPIGVVRDKHEQTLTLKVPERKTSHNSMHLDLQSLHTDMEELQNMGPELAQKLQMARSISIHKNEFERIRNELLKAQEEMQKAFSGR